MEQQEEKKKHLRGKKEQKMGKITEKCYKKIFQLLKNLQLVRDSLTIQFSQSFFLNRTESS